ncbi:peptidase M1 [Flavobacterium noncentrifugens]|uniref:Aminopeptidase N n=1 Tax=Flavobacterium noncentrifugens TaxID=1128970 RepID=A0A1G8TG80_9FLAO|nr:M1 family aminopeptidase [Flavobacterium noncentrifugens]GEP50195.1 peptidase M1 [Flavobacterium noncentrifugens]SDJ39915.1 Por secretion system C-terminal sorting domain-containing protein [Flavobacterium noncentrifugens]
MKKYYALLLLVAASSAFAQSNESEKEGLVKAERKSASKRMALQANPNTLNYDITHEKLEFTIDPAVYNIAGRVTTTYKALSNMNTIVFDLAKITDPSDDNYDSQIVVNAVRINNSDLAFTRNDTELIVTLPTTQATGVSAVIEITYEGAPAGSGFGSFIATNHGSTPVLWTLSEPFGARDWWPCKQDLNDKIDTGLDVYITAPTQYNSVSNGLQQSKTDNGNGTSTTYFKHNYPIAAYLVAIACTNYQIYTQQGGLGTAESPFFPIVNYAYPETAAANTASVAVTPSIINFYETKFGPYPFRNEKYGHAQFGWGGGMEHQSVSFMTAGNSGRYSRSLIAHEMGHQWFGDKVTCASWNNIWLNEGFATYLASMVIQNFDGENAFTQDKASMVEYIISQPGGAIYMTDDEATSVNRIFSSRLSYDKGGMVLNMLRLKLGDTNFFQALRNYLADPAHAYGYATTADLKAHLEAVSGTSLTEFFNDWVYNQGYPIYDITVRNTSSGFASIQVGQAQSHASVSFFEGPVPVRLTGSGGQELDVVLDNTSNGQIFNVAVPFVVTNVVFNPKSDIVAEENVVTLATSAFDNLSASVLYPNPASNKLTLQLPSGVAVEKTIFYNTIGQMAKETTVENTWDVSDLASGIYFMTVQTNAGTKQLKFSKK